MIGTLKNLNEKEKKIIDLLVFAFTKEGQKANDYFIGQEAEAWRLSDIYCLVQSENNTWQIFGIERGKKSKISQFEDLSDAAVCFYSQKIYYKGPYKYLHEWTKETGQEM